MHDESLATEDPLEPLPPPESTPPTGGRPCWSGLLQFSLVTIPLQAYPAVRARTVPSAHLLHAVCGRRLRYAKHCPVHGCVDAAAIVRGFEYGPGRHVVVEADELDRLRPARERALRLERFITPAQVDPLLYGGRGLYLLPDGPAAEFGFRVLHTAMRQRGRWALGRVVLSGHRQVVLLRPAATVFVLQVLHFPEQVRPIPSAPSSKPVVEGTEEIRLAGQLMDAASGNVDWNTYRDTAAQELKSLLEVKLEGQNADAITPVTTLPPLLEALRQGVAATQTHRQKPASTSLRKTRSSTTRPS
jgi:DNA end-binding protein Ku